jgi:hypothetical protein
MDAVADEEEDKEAEEEDDDEEEEEEEEASGKCTKRMRIPPHNSRKRSIFSYATNAKRCMERCDAGRGGVAQRSEGEETDKHKTNHLRIGLNRSP